VKIAANLDAKDAKALKARLEAELANICGGEWRVEETLLEPHITWPVTQRSVVPRPSTLLPRTIRIAVIFRPPV
jgi:hypothetical protein